MGGIEYEFSVAFRCEPSETTVVVCVGGGGSDPVVSWLGTAGRAGDERNGEPSEDAEDGGADCVPLAGRRQQAVDHGWTRRRAAACASADAAQGTAFRLVTVPG